MKSASFLPAAARSDRSTGVGATAVLSRVPGAPDALARGASVARVPAALRSDDRAPHLAAGHRGWGSYPDLYSDPWSQQSSRTGARVKADFIPGGGGYLQTAKHVNPTKKYNSSNQLIDSRQAGTGGIVFQNPTIGTNYLSLGISHEVGNPFCALGAIRYSLPSVQIWGSGTIAISGSRQPVPAHEAYGLFRYSAGFYLWQPMYWGPQGDFFCLSGGCPSQNINATFSSY